MARARSSGKPGDGVHVALLRGINLGSANRMRMAELAVLFGEAGCGEVRIYIQSGNVVYRAGRALAGRVPALIEKAIADRFGFRVPVVTRTAGEIEEVLRENPFLRAGASPGALHVAFLAARPPLSRVAALDPGRSPPDEFAVRGRDIYLHLPGGVGRSKLSNQYFDSKLATTSTMRNWRTVLKLAEMCRGPS